MSEENPVPAPDPALLNRQLERFKPVFYALFAAPILLLLFALFVIQPNVIRARKKDDQTEATSNLRQIGLALTGFESEYGTFPCEETVAAIIAANPSNGYDLTGTSSNALFRQLIAAGYTQSETMFYAKVTGSKKPDGNISRGEALKKGEVAFAYVAGLNAQGDPGTPIAFAPIIPGTTRFDPEGFEERGKAIVLLRNNSVRAYKIEKDGHIYDKGIDLLSPKHPVWKGKKPDIRYPEF